MSNSISDELILKLSNMERDLREGLICFSVSLVISLFSGFWIHFIDYYWLLVIAGDFLIYAFILIGKFTFRLNKYFSVGMESIFRTNSIFLRFSRLFIYGVLVQIIFYQKVITFFNIVMSVFSLSFFLLVFYNILVEVDNNQKLNKFYLRHENIIRGLIIFSALAFLGIMMRLYNIYSIGGWDEGWYADITTHMFQTQNWFQPIYYDDSQGKFLLFDKPPLMFILGSIGIALFNYTTLAVKWPMGVLSGLMGIAGYFIYEHQKRIETSNYIPPLQKDNESEKALQSILGPPEDLKKVNDGKAVGIIFGLSMAATWFLVFYARTAYLDAAIVAITAFTALFAVKAIDHWFYGNTRRAYFYIFLTAFINMLDLLAKAWQGLIVGPSIGIYLFVKYYQYFVPRQNLSDFLKEAKNAIAQNTDISKLTALGSSIVTVLLFDNFLPKPDVKQTICSSVNLLDNSATNPKASTCITFVPNFNFSLPGFSLDIWAVVIAIFVYAAVVSFTELLQTNLSADLKNKSLPETTINENSSSVLMRLIKQYLLPILLVFFSIGSGIIGAIVGAMGFEFIYDRFYSSLTEIFLTYYTYDNSMNQRLFYGEFANGTISVIFAGLILILTIWIFSIISAAVIDTILRLVLKIRLFYNNFATKIIAEWSLLVPLSFYGLFLGFWAYFLLFKSNISSIDPINLHVKIIDSIYFNLYLSSSEILVLEGIILALIAYLLASSYVELIKFIYEKIFHNNIENIYYKTWLNGMNKFLIFATVTTILIILSFYPFIAWIEFMDQYIVGHPYNIRLAGELVGVPDIPGSPGQPPLTYSWLFFEYYINWRYTGKGSAYTVVDSLGGLISPLFLACLPFFLTGIYAFIKKRDFGNLSFYGSWTFVVLITFLPAKFQLNYYYLAIFFPYFGLSAYGLFWSLRETKSGINFKNFNEKMLLSIPILLLISLSLLFPYFNNFFFIQNIENFNLSLVAVLFVVGGFILCAVLFTRSIPESFALAFIIFYLYQNLINGGIGNTDTGFLIISAVLVATPIYLIREKIPLSSGIFLFLIIMTPITTTAGWANYKAKDDDKFQQISSFIKKHDGNYNGSTWVYYDSGPRYAMRFYLGGLLLANDLNIESRNSDVPFSLNSTSYMSYYFNHHPEIKFYVVTTSPAGITGISTTYYSAAYNWLADHFVSVNPLLNKPWWQHVQLFANKSVLTTSEINFLNAQQ